EPFSSAAASQNKRIVLALLGRRLKSFLRNLLCDVSASERPARGEIWRVDLGLTAKVRPCLAMSDYPSENELALILVIPHTSAVRHNPWEFTCAKPFLKPARPSCLFVSIRG